MTLTTKELRDYLATFPDDYRVFLDDRNSGHLGNVTKFGIDRYSQDRVLILCPDDYVDEQEVLPKLFGGQNDTN